jgi:uncharacterized HAD superfamily protein
LHKQKYRYGFDIDGCLCTANISLLRLIDQLPDSQRKLVEYWYYREQKPELNPEMFLDENDEYIVITGRSKDLKDVTETWLKKFCPNYKKLIMVDLGPAYDAVNEEDLTLWSIEQAKRKAKVINKEKLDVFFEDNGDTVEYLRSLCPKTKIIKYGGRLP